MTDQPSRPRRRWYQFSLRTLLIVVTLAAGFSLQMPADRDDS